jgi:hypothetical protein
LLIINCHCDFFGKVVDFVWHRVFLWLHKTVRIRCWVIYRKIEVGLMYIESICCFSKVGNKFFYSFLNFIWNDQFPYFTFRYINVVSEHQTLVSA